MAINICICDDTANVDKMLKKIALLITSSGILWLVDQYLASQKWRLGWLSSLFCLAMFVSSLRREIKSVNGALRGRNSKRLDPYKINFYSATQLPSTPQVSIILLLSLFVEYSMNDHGV